MTKKYGMLTNYYILIQFMSHHSIASTQGYKHYSNQLDKNCMKNEKPTISTSDVYRLIKMTNTHSFLQGDHSPDTLKFPDNPLTMCGTHAHVKWYS